MWVKSNTWTVVKDLSQRPGWVAGNAIWYNSVTKAQFFKTLTQVYSPMFGFMRLAAAISASAPALSPFRFLSRLR